MNMPTKQKGTKRAEDETAKKSSDSRRSEPHMQQSRLNTKKNTRKYTLGYTFKIRVEKPRLHV